MIRVASRGTLVIPPSLNTLLDGEELCFPQSGQGAVSFLAKGRSDVVVTLVSLQHAENALGSRFAQYEESQRHESYTVIIGSHQNRKVVLRRNGVTVQSIAQEELLDSREFRGFFVSFDNGHVIVGRIGGQSHDRSWNGTSDAAADSSDDDQEVAAVTAAAAAAADAESTSSRTALSRLPRDTLLEWGDPAPLPEIKYVMLSSLAEVLAFQDIDICDPVRPDPTSETELGDSADRCSLPPAFGFADVYCSMPDLCDVVFNTRDGQDRAHSAVLVAVCSNFERLLQSQKRREGGTSTTATTGITAGQAPAAEIDLLDVSKDALHRFLASLYTARFDFAREHVEETLGLATLFGVPAIVEECERRRHQRQETRSDAEAGELDIPRSFSTAPLTRLWHSAVATNAEFAIDGRWICASRVVLGAHSPVFRTMFTSGMGECKARQIFIPDVSYGAFQVMKLFMYTGELHFGIGSRAGEGGAIRSLPPSCTACCVEEEEDDDDDDDDDEEEEAVNLLELLQVADRFQVSGLRDIAVQHTLQMMDINTVCDVLAFAERLPSCRELYDQSVTFAARRLKAVLDVSPDLALGRLSGASVCAVLSSGELFVLDELTCFKFVSKWFAHHHREEERRSNASLRSLEAAIKLLRFHLISVGELKQIQGCPLYVTSALLRSSVAEALDSARAGRALSVSDTALTLLEGGRRVIRQSLQQQQHKSFRRISSMFTDLFYLFDGDQNGVMYHLGTCYGTKPWVNPVTTRKITVTPSGKGRHTIARYLASQQYHPVSHAIPCRDGASGQLSTFWMLDIGEEHRLICNYYSVRADSCKRQQPQSWVLEASADGGGSWAVLREHVNERAIARPAQYQSWKVASPLSRIPYRLFRIRLTGPDLDGANSLLCLSNVELYGYFLRQEVDGGALGE